MPISNRKRYYAYKRASNRSYKKRYRRTFKRNDALGRANPYLGMVNVKGSHVLPAVLKTQFKFVVKFSFAIVAGVASSLAVYGNSLYDPLYSSGNSQPVMFKELMNFYTRYNVIGTKLKLVVTNMSTTDPIEFYVIPTTDNSSTYTFETASVMPGAQSCQLGIDSSNNIKTLEFYRRSSTVWGLSTYDNAMTAQYNANPSALWYIRMSASSASVSSNDSDIYATAYFTFFTVLSQPRIVVTGP